MPDYKNKQTGEVISIPRVRVIFHDNGTKTEVNLSDTSFDMTQWEQYNEGASTYETIRVTKAKTDGGGVR